MSSIATTCTLNAKEPTRESPQGRDREFQIWMERANNGDAEALGSMIIACHIYMIRIDQREIPLALRSKFDAVDLVQETSLRAHRDFSAFAGTTRGEFRRWLRRILLNNLAMVRRQYEQTDKRRVSRESHADVAEAAIAPLDGHTAPGAWLIQSEQQQRLKESLSRLPDRMQQVIRLRSREHIAFAEIGERLGRSAGAARKLWVRAIARLQRELRHHGKQP